MRYVVIKDGKVISTPEWDGTTPFVHGGDDIFPSDLGNKGDSWDGAVFTPPAALPLNQQYTPVQFGNLMIHNFSDMNAARGLSSAQTLQLAGDLNAYFICLQLGKLQTVLDTLGDIPVDGVLITNAIIAQFNGALTAYLTGL